MNVAQPFLVVSLWFFTTHCQGLRDLEIGQRGKR